MYKRQAYKNLEYDPDNAYSVPYTWGVVGIVYNKTMVQEPPTSWDALWDIEYAGNVLMFNTVSYTQLMSRLEPPPSIRLMIKVDTAGTNTMVMPVAMPGTDSGMSTRVRILLMPAPRSWAASTTLWSILVMAVYSGRII